ncbi:hypothetical protein E8E12_000117 [Didymella heteroderae]|uniref:Uncharacterized protein n=1 Tax=Didymella heteroderae TaxID=1769908 RepID=A0A9P4WFC4_9PLEO|nr:hypothetical protein E8E12_000117 [Didymella heteroderae]
MREASPSQSERQYPRYTTSMGPHTATSPPAASEGTVADLAVQPVHHVNGSYMQPQLQPQQQSQSQQSLYAPTSAMSARPTYPEAYDGWSYDGRYGQAPMPSGYYSHEVGGSVSHEGHTSVRPCGCGHQHPPTIGRHPPPPAYRHASPAMHPAAQGSRWGPGSTLQEWHEPATSSMLANTTPCDHLFDLSASHCSSPGLCMQQQAREPQQTECRGHCCGTSEPAIIVVLQLDAQHVLRTLYTSRPPQQLLEAQAQPSTTAEGVAGTWP